MSEPAIRQWRFAALGTAVTVTLAGAQAGAERAARCMESIERRLHEFARAAWPWSDGELAAFNARLAAGAVAAVPETLRPLFEAAEEFRRRSAGAFDARLAKLVELWGFDRVEHLRVAPPDGLEIAARLAALRAAPGHSEAARHYGPAAGIGWDFGAIGKGWIAARALDWLAGEGFDDALIDLGGQLSARGRRDDRAWRAGIRDPRSPALAPRLIASLELRDETIATHGDDQRCFEHDGVRYSHLIDPRTGWPAQGLRSLTVVAADPLHADAGGAALFVAGPQEWPRLARALGLDCVLAVHADGRLTATPALAARLARPEGLHFEPV